MKSILPKNEWKNFFEKVTAPLPKTIRIKSFSTFEKNKPTGWTLKPVVELNEAFFIKREDQKELALGKTLEHFSGEIYVQSLSSMLPVKVLNPFPGEKILDMCAAPGSKSTFLSEKMENSGVLICNELSSSRSKKLSANLTRMGSLNFVMTQSNGSTMQYFFGQEFDKILLDAPCSSEGFARRDSKFFEKMWQEKKIFTAAKLQKQLILSAFNMLVPGGTMVYSTCTSAPEENEFVIAHLLSNIPQAELLPIDLGAIPSRKGLTEFDGKSIPAEISKNVRRINPHLETENWSSESFFIALIRKSAPQKLTPPKKPFIKNPPKIPKKQQQAEVITRLAKKFGIDKSIFKPFILVEKDNEFFLTTRDAAGFCQKNLFRKLGLKILDKDRHITTAFALNFGTAATKNKIILTNHQKQKWMEGYDLIFDDSFPKKDFKNGDEMMILFDRFCLGYGKVMDTKLKNKLNRDLVF